MDDFMFQSASDLLSHASLVRVDWHQTGSGRYVKSHSAAAQNCRTVIPLDTRSAGGKQGSRARLAVLYKGVTALPKTALVISDSFLRLGLDSKVPTHLITGCLRILGYTEVVMYCKARLRLAEAQAYLETFDAVADVAVIIYNLNDAAMNREIAWPGDFFDQLPQLLIALGRKCKRLCFVVPQPQLFSKYKGVPDYENRHSEFCAILRENEVCTDDAGYLLGQVTSFDGEHFDASCDDALAKAVVHWTHMAIDVAEMNAILPSKKRALEARKSESAIVIVD